MKRILSGVFCLLLVLLLPLQVCGAGETEYAIPAYGGQLTLPDGFTLFRPDEPFGETEKALLKLLKIEEDALFARMQEQHCIYYGISSDLTGEWSVCFFRDKISERLFDLAALSAHDLSLYPSYASLPEEEKESALFATENRLRFLVQQSQKEDDDGLYYEASFSTIVGGYHLIFSYAERGEESLFAERSKALRQSAESVRFSEIPMKTNPILYPVIAAGILIITIVAAFLLRRKFNKSKEAL